MLFGIVFMLLTLATIVLAFVAPILGVRRWRGGWRLAAAVPLAVMALVVLNIVFGVMFDASSHNLWPFEILLAGVPCVLAMGVMALLRRLAAARRR